MTQTRKFAKIFIDENVLDIHTILSAQLSTKAYRESAIPTNTIQVIKCVFFQV